MNSRKILVFDNYDGSLLCKNLLRVLFGLKLDNGDTNWPFEHEIINDHPCFIMIDFLDGMKKW